MKRNPWPYAIVAYFVIFIAAVTIWITFAVRNDQQLVRSDYYEQELKFQNDLDGQARGATTHASLDYDALKQLISISIPSPVAKGAIYFYRPSDAKLDRQIDLVLEGGAQKIDVARFQGGLWKVRLTWTAEGIEYHHDTRIVLAPTKLSSL